MKNPSSRSGLTKAILGQLTAGMVVIGLASVGTPSATATGSAAGTISGVVFNDFNANGFRDLTSTIPNAGGGTIPVAVDSGVAGTQVAGYDNDGDLVGTATTTLDGTYSLTVSAATSTNIRLEFTLPSGYESGPVGSHSATTEQFVTVGATNADLGIAKPEQYCQNDPLVITSCFIKGSAVSAAAASGVTLRSVPYSGGENVPFPSLTGVIPPGAKAPSFNSLANYQGWGSVNAIATHRQSKSVFAAAFYKPNVAVRVPYSVSPAVDFTGDGSPDSQIVVTEAASVFGPAGPGAIYRTGMVGPFVVLPTGTEPAVAIPAVALADSTNDLPALTAAHAREVAIQAAYTKLGVGDIDVSEDGSTLYAVNLADRTIYHLPLVGSPPAPIPLSQVPSLIKSPALTTAQVPCASDEAIRPMGLGSKNGTLFVGATCTSTGNMTVVAYDPTTTSFTGTALTITTYGASPECCFGSWYPMSYTAWYWPTDIVFDNGDMVVATREGRADVSANVTGTGDILRACATGSNTFSLESNATCGSVTTAGANTSNGPGGGEYYFQDQGEFGESGLGGLAQVPGFPNVAMTTYDMMALYEGNLSWVDHRNGTRSKVYSLYATATEPNTLGKSNGLGDVDVLCDMAPIEIGDRVWIDANRNGRQDPDESPIAGVVVELLDAGQNLIATANTDGSGNYSFSSGSGTSSAAHQYGLAVLSPNTPFTVRIASGQAPLDGLALTLPTALGGVLADSNGLVLGANGATYSGTTGAAGANNHSIDFGFAPPPTFELGNRVFLDANNSGTLETTESGIGSVTLGLFRSTVSGLVAATDASGAGVPDQITDGSGFYRFSNLLAGDYVVVVRTPNAGTLTGLASSTGAGQTANPNNNNDLDDNGLDTPMGPGDVVPGAIQSGVVTLGPTAEPVGEAGPGGLLADANGNFTVDFGFYTVAVATTAVVTTTVPTTGVETTAVETTAVATTAVETTAVVTTAVATTALTTTATTTLVASTTFASTVPLVLPDTTLITTPITTIAPALTLPPTSASEPSTTSTGLVQTTLAGSGAETPKLTPMVTPIVKGVIFVDTDTDGTQDPGEPSLPNVTIEIRTRNGDLVAVVTTDGEGRFSQPVPATGDYVISIVSGVPPEYSFLTQRTISVSVLGTSVVSEAVFRVNSAPQEVAFTGNNSLQLTMYAFGALLVGLGLVRLVRDRSRTAQH
jgi:hypothetical protein